MLVLLAQADCLLVRPPHAPAAEAGERCPIIRLCASAKNLQAGRADRRSAVKLRFSEPLSFFTRN